MRKVDVVTIGSAIKDITFISDEVEILRNKKNLLKQKLMAVEYGAKLEIDDLHLTYGGGAMNVAIGLKNFGLKVAPIINIGKDFSGQEIFYFLKQRGINTSLIQTDKHNATGFSFILVAKNDKEHTIFTYKGASQHLKLPNLNKIRTNWYYVGPLSVSGWEYEFIKVVRQAEKTWFRPEHQKINILWTPGRRQLIEYKKMIKLMPRIHVLILNKDEATELAINAFGRKVDKKKINQSRYLLDTLKKLKMKNLIITAGDKGAYGLDEKGHYYFKPARKTKKVDTVGAGDAFASGFLSAYHKTGTFSKGIEYGIKNSSAVLTKIGAQNGLLKGGIR